MTSWGPDAAICATGTTIKKAGSKEAFRSVDHDLPLSFARLAHQAGTQNFALVSAIGASVDSSFFYARVKGELERDVREIGFRSLTILRPSIIEGERSKDANVPSSSQSRSGAAGSAFSGSVRDGGVPLDTSLPAPKHCGMARHCTGLPLRSRTPINQTSKKQRLGGAQSMSTPGWSIECDYMETCNWVTSAAPATSAVFQPAAVAKPWSDTTFGKATLAMCRWMVWTLSTRLHRLSSRHHVNDRTVNARGWLDLVNEHLAAKALGRQLAIAQCQLGASCYHSRRCNKTDIHDSELSSGCMSLLSAGGGGSPYR